MKHFMKLKNDPFCKIKNESKIIEMRLFDEKRQMLNIKDVIEFTNMSTNEKILCEVTNLYRYKDFDELYKNHDKTSIGYSENEVANPSDMSMYYSLDDIKKYGTLAIEIRKINM